ncbi:MAG: carbohydrate-binding module family 14 protein [Alphaproteobacteria bacterium]|nr:carbohydrate-binding module family 14 protein [Alphaproteobacteria bacterium]
MKKTILSMFVMGTLCFVTSAFAVGPLNLTCPAFDTSTGNTATAPNPLDLIWQFGSVCNVPQSQTFTDDLGTYHFQGGCSVSCPGGIISDGVCIPDTTPPASSCARDWQIDLSSPGACPAATAPTCPPGASNIFFSHPATLNCSSALLPDGSWGACQSRFFYYECVNGVATCKKCPIGMQWSSAFGKCVCQRGLFPCGSAIEVGAHRQQVCPGDGKPCGNCTLTRCAMNFYMEGDQCIYELPSNPCHNPESITVDMCPPHPGGIGDIMGIFMANPFDCDEYIICSYNSGWWGTEVLPFCMRCPYGTVWNQGLETCDWPTCMDCTHENPPCGYACC